MFISVFQRLLYFRSVPCTPGTWYNTIKYETKQKFTLWRLAFTLCISLRPRRQQKKSPLEPLLLPLLLLLLCAPRRSDVKIRSVWPHLERASIIHNDRNTIASCCMNSIEPHGLFIDSPRTGNTQKAMLFFLPVHPSSRPKIPPPDSDSSSRVGPNNV